MVVVVGLVLIALMMPAVQSAREAARQGGCKNNLHQIGLALLNYESVHGHFPPAVIGPPNVPPERQFSWIVALLPMLDQKALYDSLRLDLPWNAPENAALLKVSLPVLRVPLRSDRRRKNAERVSQDFLRGHYRGQLDAGARQHCAG